MNTERKIFFVPLLLLVIFTACHPVYKYIHSDDVLSWEDEIRVIDSLNLVEPSDENTLLVTGSSSVRLWETIHSDLAPYRVMQRGYGGARLSDYNYYAARIIPPHQFQAILIFVANDISGGDQDRTPREVFKLYVNLVDQIRERNPETPVFWIETTPTPSRWHAIDRIRKANALIRDYCEKSDDLHFITTYDAYIGTEGTPDSAFFRRDMLHLNADGYRQWTGIIRGALRDEGIIPPAGGVQQGGM